MVDGVKGGRQVKQGQSRNFKFHPLDVVDRASETQMKYNEWGFRKLYSFNYICVSLTQSITLNR